MWFYTLNILYTGNPSSAKDCQLRMTKCTPNTRHCTWSATRGQDALYFLFYNSTANLFSCTLNARYNTAHINQSPACLTQLWQKKVLLTTGFKYRAILSKAGTVTLNTGKVMGRRKKTTFINLILQNIIVSLIFIILKQNTSCWSNWEGERKWRNTIFKREI